MSHWPVLGIIAWWIMLPTVVILLARWRSHGGIDDE